MKKQRTVFLLDCAVYRPDRNFRRVAAACEDNGLPVSYALVPGKLTPELCGFMAKRKNAVPPFCAVQYGCKTPVPASGRNAAPEILPGNPARMLKQNIGTAKTRMDAICKELFAPVFVPPGFCYDAATVKTCEELKFRVFAAGPKKFPVKTDMVYVTFDVDLHLACRGNRTAITAGEMLAMTEKKLSKAACAGVFFSHQNFSKQDLSAFEQYCVLLKKLAASGKVRLCTLAALAR